MPRSVPVAIPPLLSFVAGYLDSCTFLALFGGFVAQVTGSFVLTGVQLVMPDPGLVIKMVGIPVFFLAGIVTTLLVRRAERRGRSALVVTLALELLLLTGLLVSWLAGSPPQGPNSPSVLAASLSALSAMGVQSAIVRLLVHASPSTNVMTSNTTQLAIDTTEFVLAWWPLRRASADAKAAAGYAEVKRRLTRLYPVMLGFFLGTLAGAVAYVRLDLWCVALVIAIIGALLVWAAASDRIAAKLADGIAAD